MKKVFQLFIAIIASGAAVAEHLFNDKPMAKGLRSFSRVLGSLSNFLKTRK